MFITASGSTYRPLRTSEMQYESIVLELLPRVFEGWSVVRWKKRVFTPEGRGVEPDLILLSQSAFEWVVVEVELGRHSISGHIDDQLDRLSRATYDASLVESFVGAGVGADEAKQYLRSRPSMLCVVDEGSSRLTDCCQGHGFDVAVMEPYLDELSSPGLYVRSMPGQYRRLPSTAVEYELRRAAEGLFGRTPFVVPDAFPRVDQFTLRVLSEDVSTTVVTLGGQRLVFLDPQYESAASTSGGFKLGVIDIDRAIFEMQRS